MEFGDPFFGNSYIDAIIRLNIVVLVMTLVVIYLTYGERKVLGRIQQRIGPNRTGPGGLLQGFADALKLLSKEDLRPRNADRWVFELAPFAAFVPIFVILVTLPFAENWGVRNLSLGLFFVFSILGLNIVGILMAGLGSGSKYALLGGVRAAAQMISYEIPLVISLLAVAMLAGTFNLNEIVLLQETRPYIIVQPLAFVIFFTAMLAELHRAPFDIPVAESEVSGGYFIEYSGMRWSLFQLAEYTAMWAFSIFAAVVFLGGWAWPMGTEWGWGWQLFLTIAKSFALIFSMMWIRGTVVRLRIDQLMNFCWKGLIEISFALLLVNGFFLYYGWPEEVLALVQWAATIIFIGFIYTRGVRRSRANEYIGTYRNPEAATP